MANKIHTVIFDLDGTLSDSAILTLAAFERIAPRHGFPVPSMEAIKSAMGYATPEFYYILFPDSGQDMVKNIGMLIEEEELRLLSSLGEKLLFDGCRELLMRLREHDIRLWIASTGQRHHVFPVLGETKISIFFDKITCGRPDKNEILREMTIGSDPDGYIMVGDMKKDYEAARANGIVSVGACYGYCKREQLDFDFYIDAPLDLLNILKL